uniref:Uncharacterized protein n=1 Tax=Pristhesancus plagipennis TaxID=1955184 RepID=A0A2K8JPR7_PRIPG|nr:secreted hypothetical protein [Pristhesancus plagipennis]
MKSMALLVGFLALGVARASWAHGGWAGVYGAGAPWTAAGHWGGAPAPVHDTPEVAAAKAAHLAAHAAARSGAWAGAGAGAWHGAGAWNGAGAWDGAWNNGDDGQWHDDTHQYDNGAWSGNDDGQWHGDWSGRWSGENGQWHGDNSGQWDGDNGQWHGDNSGQWNPAADGSWAGNAWAHNGGVWAGHAGNAWAYGGGWAGLGPHGLPRDTPEVAAAKAAHLAAHAHAAHHYRRRRSVLGLGLAAPLAVINPNALPVPLDDVHTAAAKNAQLVQQATEGTRNILGGGIPLALPADTHEVAVGKVAHAIASETQKAIVGAHGAWGHGAWGHGLVGAHLW